MRIQTFNMKLNRQMSYQLCQRPIGITKKNIWLGNSYKYYIVILGRMRDKYTWFLDSVETFVSSREVTVNNSESFDEYYASI